MMCLYNGHHERCQSRSEKARQEFGLVAKVSWGSNQQTTTWRGVDLALNLHHHQILKKSWKLRSDQDGGSGWPSFGSETGASERKTHWRLGSQGPTGSRYPTRPELFFKYPTLPDPKIENDWVPGNWISFGKQQKIVLDKKSSYKSDKSNKPWHRK